MMVSFEWGFENGRFVEESKVNFKISGNKD